MRIALFDLALGVDLVDREEARAVEVEVRVEEVLAERIHGAGEALADVGVAEVFADDCAILAFDQGIVVGMARPRAGEFDAQLVQ